jgi:hypothetical protein
MSTDHCCAEMKRHLQDDEAALVYLDHFREYGVRILDGGSSFQAIQFCPWCGSKLPESLRDKWFETIWQMGLEPEDDKVPTLFRSDKWWRCSGPANSTSEQV